MTLVNTQRRDGRSTQKSMHGESTSSPKYPIIVPSGTLVDLPSGPSELGPTDRHTFPTTPGIPKSRIEFRLVTPTILTPSSLSSAQWRKTTDASRIHSPELRQQWPIFHAQKKLALPILYTTARQADPKRSTQLATRLPTQYLPSSTLTPSPPNAHV